MTNFKRVDFLRALDENPPAAALETIARKPHNVWETAIWLQVTTPQAGSPDGRPFSHRSR